MEKNQNKVEMSFVKSTINSLHQVNVMEGVDAFIDDKASDYKVVIPFNATSKLIEAAEFFVNYCEKATGVQLAIEHVVAGEWNENSKWIVLGCDELFVAAGLVMPQQDIGAVGYYIKSVGKSVFVAVKGEYAYRRAVLCLLHHILGYERYAADTVVFQKDGKTLPVMDIVERPDFDFYTDLDGFSGDGYYGMGFDRPIYIPTGSVGHFHNSFVLLPPDLYAEQHPAWYGDTMKQLCYTAHGNEEEYALMVETMAESLIKYIESDPDKCNITMTQEDNWMLCECEACKKSREKYDGANSAAIIKFANAVDNVVQDYFQKKADALGERKREINIVFFAYQNTEKPPVRESENGDYSPIDDSVICNKNVGVYIAPIIAKYHKSFYDEINIDAARNMRQWGACCKKLHVWLYDTNYAQYLFPFNTFETIVDTYRFCKNVGAYYMLVEGQHNQINAPGFMKLKDYLNSKALFDLNCDYNKILDDFFVGYFGPASKQMRRFFNEIQSRLLEMEKLYPGEINGGIYDNTEQSMFWAHSLLIGWMALIDEAKSTINNNGSLTAEQRELYLKHIELESIFPQFAILRLHAEYYTEEEFEQMATAFRKSCFELEVFRHYEHNTLEKCIFPEWNLKND